MRRSRSGLLVVGLLALAAATTACDRVQAPAAARPAARVHTPPPDGVVATIATPSLHDALDGLRGFADAVRAGSAAGIDGAAAANAIARAAGIGSLDGLDLDAPLALVIAERPLASIVLGKVRDAKQLEAVRGTAFVSSKDGWAAIGPAAAVKAIEPWARAELLGVPVTGVEAVAYVQPLLSRHAAELAMARSAMGVAAASNPQMAKLFAFYLDGFASIGADSERVVVGATADAAHVELEIALIARAGTRLASFAALQRPSDFALLGALPVDAPGAMQFVGRFALGPYRAAMIDLVPATMNLGDATAQWTKAFEGLADLMTGEFAGVGSMSLTGGMAMTQVFPISDPAVAERLVRDTLTVIGKGRVVDSMGIKMSQSGLLDVGSHGGKPIHAVETSVDLASVSEEQRPMMATMYKVAQRLNVGFGRGALVVATGDIAGVGRALDALDGKAARKPISPATQALLDDAKKRGESFVGLVDVAAMMADVAAASTGTPPAGRATSPGMVFAFGGGDGAARLRVRVMADGMRAALNLPR